MSKFQIILLSAFGFFIVMAVMVFALYRGGGSAQATITVWGDLPDEVMNAVINTSSPTRDKSINIKYVEKSADTIDQDFTEALAQGNGPDLLITTQDKVWKERSKLVPIPYQSVSQKDFQQTFVEEGELFLSPNGLYGLPISIDPMVLYYNRDALSAAAIARPIQYWDELYAATPKLTKRDGAGNILESAMALGETRNIPHSKEILSLLLLQAGTPVTGYVGADLRSLLASTFDQTVMPGEAALDFYTQFSNPSKPYYTWNRTLASAQSNFTSGDSAYYLGFASEYLALRNKNPNLNFAVAPVPQSRVSGRAVTFGKIHAVAVSRGTRNASAALSAALNLISQPLALDIAQKLSLPPARRDLLSTKPTDAVMPIFYDAALQSKGWLDPDEMATKKLFDDMTESVSSGRARLYESVSSASQDLDNLIKK